jgi:hypothetical protein
MKRNATLALVLCLAVLGTAIEARADCHYVRGSIAETRISLGTEPTRILGNVTGVLNGAVTVTIISPPPNVRSLDIFVTKSGDVLRAEGRPTRTPGVPHASTPVKSRECLRHSRFPVSRKAEAGSNWPTGYSQLVTGSFTLL